MSREIKKQFDVGHIDGTTLEIIAKYDYTSKPNIFDATYFYDVLDHLNNKFYKNLTYKDIKTLVDGYPLRRNIVFFIDQKWVDRMHEYSIHSDYDVTTLSSNLQQPSELEMSLINHVKNYMVDEDEKSDNEDGLYELALFSLDYLIAHSEELLDEEAKEYLKTDYTKNIRQLHKFQVGDKIKGKYSIYEVIFKYPGRDKFHRAVFDVKDIHTGKIYFKVNSRDIRRIAKNDYPVITANGKVLRLLDWAKQLSMRGDSLRNRYRECNGDEETMTRLIEGHLKNIEEGKNKYDGTFTRFKKKED